MSWNELLTGQRESRQMTRDAGNARGAAYAGAGEAIGAGISGGVARSDRLDEAQKGRDFQSSERKGHEQWSSAESAAEFKRKTDYGAENANALQDTLNALRGTSGAAAQGQEALGQFDSGGAASSYDPGGLAAPGESPVPAGGPDLRRGGPSGGPSSSATPKLQGFTDPDVASTAWKAIQEDEANRRKWGQQDEDFAGGARAFDAARTGDPQNPLAGVSGSDMMHASRGGYGDDVKTAANAMRQSGYEDPIAEQGRADQAETLVRNRGFEDVMRPKIAAGQDAQNANEVAQAARAMRGPAPKAPKPAITPGEVNQLLATTTGRQHEQVRSLNKQLEQARKTQLDPLARPETRAAAQQQVDAISEQIRQVQAEADATQAQWLKVLGGTTGMDIPGAAGPASPAPGGPFDTSAIDQELTKRGVAPGAPQPTGR